MLISVVMITHNRENLVHNMIEDVIRQNFQDYEFVIIDNGSKDRSGAVADRYASKHQGIKVFHLNKDISIGAARNVGIRESRGEYVAFVDDDDRITTDYLDNLYKHTYDGKYDISACGATEYRAGVEKPFIQIDKREVLSNEEALYELLKRRKIRSMSPAKLIRKKLFLRYPFREDVVHDDIHVIYKYLTDSNGVSIDDAPKYRVIRHDENISSFLDQPSGITREFIEEYYMAYMDRKSFLESRFPEMREYLVYNVASFMISMCDKINKYDIKDCKDIYNKMVSYIKDNQNEALIMKYIASDELYKYYTLVSDNAKEWLKCDA